VELTLRKVGNSLGVILPAKATEALNVREGDKLYLVKAADGYRITPYDPEFKRKLKVADDLIQRYRDALKELAK
jgi:putative addiction module antidote